VANPAQYEHLTFEYNGTPINGGYWTTYIAITTAATIS
jgi:hypothetical protein